MVLKSLFGKKDQNQNNTQQSSTTPEPQEENSSTQNQQIEPIPAMHLENAIVDNARSDNPETRAKVYQELLFSDLLLALAEADPNAEQQNQEQQESESNNNSNVNVAILSNAQGVQFAAAFTSAVAARRWRAEGGQYVSVRGQDVFKLLEPSPAEVIVINPGSAPFVVLNKVEYRQLAMGIVPQSSRSPVQVAANEDKNGEASAPAQDSMQIAFPPDVFSDEQKLHAQQILSTNNNIEAVAIGAILPPNAPKDTGWMRTVFLRTQGVEANQEVVQKFCVNVRESLVKDNSLFQEVPFEVGVMPDPNFWIAMHQNKFVLLDKNPPQISENEATQA